MLGLGTLITIAYLSAAAERPIKIGINDWTGYDPFILADKTDLFNKNNVRVEIKRFASTVASVQALKNREIQGAGLTLDEVFLLVDSGFKGKVVLVVDYSIGGDMLIGQKEINSIADLKGKKIGFEGTVVGEFLLSRALHMNRVKRASIKLINVKAENWLSSFAEKKVDGLVTFNPVATTLLNEHDGNILFSSADIPFQIIDVLVFEESFYDDNKVAIGNILKGWFEALTYLKTHENKHGIIIDEFRPYS